MEPHVRFFAVLIALFGVATAINIATAQWQPAAPAQPTAPAANYAEAPKTYEDGVQDGQLLAVREIQARYAGACRLQATDAEDTWDIAMVAGVANNLNTCNYLAEQMTAITFKVDQGRRKYTCVCF